MSTRNAKLIGITLLGIVLFNFPILGIFSKNTWFVGLPSAVLYLFLLWLVFIFLIRRIVEPPSFS
jgi:hypothetical protein